MKKCSTCGECKDTTEFQKNSQQSDGLSCYCKLCTSNTNKKRYAGNVNNFDWQLSKMLAASRTRAKRKGLEHTLNIQELKFLYPDDGLCPVFGFQMLWGHPKQTSPSLDRIDSSKVYTLDNCQVISNKANFLKNDATLEELQSLVNYLKEL